MLILSYADKMGAFILSHGMLPTMLAGISYRFDVVVFVYCLSWFGQAI